MICPLLRFPHKNSPYIFIQDAPLPHNALPAAAKRRTTFCQNGMVTYMPNYDHSVNVAWTCYIPVSCAVSLSIKENFTFWLFFFFFDLLSLYFFLFEQYAFCNWALQCPGIRCTYPQYTKYSKFLLSPLLCEKGISTFVNYIWLQLCVGRFCCFSRTYYLSFRLCHKENRALYTWHHNSSLWERHSWWRQKG